MKDSWDDPAFAAAWDHGAELGNPSRAAQVRIVVAIVTRLYRSGATILDLGAGSGQVEAALLRACPNARIVAADSSLPMLALARKRLESLRDRVSLVHGEFEQVEAIGFPDSPYQIALSVQALHHVPDPVKQRVVRRVHRVLEPAGVFLLVDRIDLASPELRPVHAALWEELDRNVASAGSLPADQFFERLAGKSDHPSGLEAHLAMFRAAGFRAGCIHLELNRAIFTAVRPAA